MKPIVLSTTLTLAAVTPFTMKGADSPENPNRFSVGPRFGLNFKADYQSTAPAGPGPAIGGANHEYQDGYVRVDSSGNAGGRTWNWGYQDASQVVADTMEFHSTQTENSSIPANTDISDDPQFGFELVYQRVFGNLPVSSGRWGLEAGFAYTDIDLNDTRGGTGLSTVTTDVYQLNGVLPPGAGYSGTFQGPGTFLGDTPTRTAVSSAASLTSRQELTGEMFMFRLGPFAEWDFTPRFSFAASVGLTLASASVDYDFSDTASTAGGTLTTSGHSSNNDLLYGPYVGGTLRYDFTDHWGLYLGVQFQNLNDLETSAGGRTARLDSGATFYGTVGASWRF